MPFHETPSTFDRGRTAAHRLKRRDVPCRVDRNSKEQDMPAQTVSAQKIAEADREYALAILRLELPQPQALEQEAHTHEEGVPCSLRWSPPAVTREQLEQSALLELRYEEYFARRELEELFASGEMWMLEY
jgi:hypothetical protein